MSSLMRSLVLITSVVSVVTAEGQRWTQPPKCIDSETKDIATLKKCYETVSLAVTLVDNSEGDFDEASDAAEPDDSDEDSDIDYRFLRYLINGEFNDQGVFYDDTAATLDDLSDAVTALEIAGRSPTSPALRDICPKLNLDLFRRFQLQPSALYDAACRGLFIPTPSSSTSCSTVSTLSSGSLTSPMSSSSNSLTTPPPLAVTTTRSASSTTSCTTGASASASVRAVSKRQAYGDTQLEILIRKVASAIFAVGLIETNQDDSECQVDDYWVQSYNSLGLDGNYIQDLM
jgi:hypothetical protein